MTRRRIVLAAVPLTAIALVAAACGGGSGSSTGAGQTTPPVTETAAGQGTTLQLAADPTGALTFDKTTLEAPAGKVTIVMTNSSPVGHDIAIEGNGVDVKGSVASNGGTSTVSADLKPGTYTFYCSVDGHKAAGMQGTLTVK